MLALDLGQRIPDLRLFLIAAGALAVALAWLATATARLRRSRARIPIRIHVGGTRGKSTTTRLVAAGLRAGGMRVVAKTTGSAARLILPDGTEEPWPRRGPASIAEQAWFVSRAAALGAEAIVVECMAVRPDMVAASEAILEATGAVIVNARPDHAEDIGEAPQAMANALAGMVPQAGLLVVSAEAALPAIVSRAAMRGTAVSEVETGGLDGPAADRALALALCSSLGVAPDVAGPAMAAAVPDPGFLSDYRLDAEDLPARFINAFACNDIASLAQLWQERSGDGDAVVLFNARPDRPLRSRDFLAWLSRLERRPRLVMTGDRLAERLARRMGWTGEDVVWSGDDPGSALGHAARLAGRTGTVWGVGNWKGGGEAIVARLARQRVPC